ncbi:asparaginase domain-containing protein [Nocardia sp. CDC153]|uniref:asparaginase domain-containing protein n=1 Tax=Nocardia sp. CDC153 TaxID=3112167 RepID=UPI002DBF090C|nr:asparaginase domain-containing protein [Nocardia sp. CDC153]MEC3954426.1 asparaginase domain-containing protein [Nocardia sp. CDC153]
MTRAAADLAVPEVSVLRVEILYTGGTFGMVEGGGGLRPRAGMGGEVADLVDAYTDRFGIPVEFRYTELDRVIDSANADPETACRIARRVRAAIATTGPDGVTTGPDGVTTGPDGVTTGPDGVTTGPDGVIVIHGTDTMAYTGARLAFELHDIAVPVVLTGAQIPLGRPASDAADNLMLALNSIATQPAPGTFIAFGSSLHPAVRASKRSSDGYDGFTTVRPLTPPSMPPARPAASPGVETPGPVGLFTVFPGMDSTLLDAALRIYHGGVVLECYGAGTMPTSDDTVTAIRRATERGTPVVVITHCDSGTVDLGLYEPGRALLAAGAIGGGDLTREAALAKLAHLAGLGLDADEVRRWMTTNLVGELADPTSHQ